MTKQELLGMELHKEIYLDPSITILRVFGGWIYYLNLAGTRTKESINTCIFVPEEINANIKNS